MTDYKPGGVAELISGIASFQQQYDETEFKDTNTKAGKKSVQFHSDTAEGSKFKYQKTPFSSTTSKKKKDGSSKKAFKETRLEFDDVDFNEEIGPGHSVKRKKTEVDHADNSEHEIGNKKKKEKKSKRKDIESDSEKVDTSSSSTIIITKAVKKRKNKNNILEANSGEVEVNFNRTPTITKTAKKKKKSNILEANSEEVEVTFNHIPTTTKTPKKKKKKSNNLEANSDSTSAIAGTPKEKKKKSNNLEANFDSTSAIAGTPKKKKKKSNNFEANSKVETNSNSTSTITKTGKKRKNNNNIVTNDEENKDNVFPPKKKFKQSNASINQGKDLIKENNKSSSTEKNDFFEENNKFTVFVGNVPLKYDHKAIAKKFSTFGEIQSVRVRCVPAANPKLRKKAASNLKKWNPNRSSAVAYVKFTSQEAVEAALKANGMVLDGHQLHIDNSVQKKHDNNRAVFVGQLPYDVEEDALWDLFDDCGKIMGVRIVRDSKTSMGKGFGFVNFESAASVELALELNGTLIRNRPITVVRAKKKKKLPPKESNTHPLRGKIPKDRWRNRPENSRDGLGFQGSEATVKKKKVKKFKPNKGQLRKNRISKMLNSGHKMETKKSHKKSFKKLEGTEK